MKKLAIALIIGGCLIVFSAGAALAVEGSASRQVAVSQESKSADPILQKQQEIDRYVFEEHAKDLEKQGITVTHTGPMDGYVEIGITPYSDANAEYLYGIFGKDKAKVVEEQQATTFVAAKTGAAAPAVEAAAPAAETASSTDADRSYSVLYWIGGLALLAVLGFGMNRAIALKMR